MSDMAKDGDKNKEADDKNKAGSTKYNSELGKRCMDIAKFIASKDGEGLRKWIIEQWAKWGGSQPVTQEFSLMLWRTIPKNATNAQEDVDMLVKTIEKLEDVLNGTNKELLQVKLIFNRKSESDSEKQFDVQELDDHKGHQYLKIDGKMTRTINLNLGKEYSLKIIRNVMINSNKKKRWANFKHSDISDDIKHELLGSEEIRKYVDEWLLDASEDKKDAEIQKLLTKYSFIHHLDGWLLSDFLQNKKTFAPRNIDNPDPRSLPETLGTLLFSSETSYNRILHERLVREFRDQSSDNALDGFDTDGGETDRENFDDRDISTASEAVKNYIKNAKKRRCLRSQKQTHLSALTGPPLALYELSDHDDILNEIFAEVHKSTDDVEDELEKLYDSLTNEDE